MSWLSMLAAAGVWPALPLTGYWMLGRRLRMVGESVPLVTATALATVAGFCVWSPILLGAAVAGVYRGDVLGLLGWGVTLFSVPAALRSPRHARPTAGSIATPTGLAVAQQSHARRLDRRNRQAANPAPRNQPAVVSAKSNALSSSSAIWEWLLAAGLLLAAALYLGFPAESIYGGRDEGVYSMHAIRIARDGRVDVPYPWPADADAIFFDTWVGFPGFYKTRPTMTVQFGHLFPVWLAQAYCTFGAPGLFRLNAILAVLSAAVFYGLCRAFLPCAYAVAATLFFSLNPSQLWMARMPLSEIPTQLVTWSGLFLLVRALTDGDRFLARWGGVFLGLSAVVRFDSLLLLPMLFLAHAAWKLIDNAEAERASVWLALYQTGLPIFALGLGYFAVFSTPYLMERHYWQKLVGAAIGSALVLLAMRPAVVQRLRPLVTSAIFVAAVGAGVLAVAAYAYWIRPITTGPPQLRYWWPGYYWDYSKGNHSIESFVNLAQYLSPFVIWLAIGGWCVSLWEITRTQRRGGLVVVLVVAIGMSAVYLYDHGNTPDHFWAIRRYVAVTIPGFIVCATLGAHWVLTKVQSPWSFAAGGVGLVLLAAFTVRADALILSFAEDKGYFAQLQQLAEKLPRDQVILARGFTSWITPLWVAFDRHVIPLNLDARAKGRAALDAWVARQAARHKPAYLLCEGPVDLTGFQTRQLETVLISRVHTESTTTPLPKKIVSEDRTLHLYEIAPAQ